MTERAGRRKNEQHSFHFSATSVVDRKSVFSLLFVFFIDVHRMRAKLLPNFISVVYELV
jgi:hypothetical protein